MATEADQHLPANDHTKLSNINSCPTWGIMRYSMHKKMPGASRELPLEAGHAAHESFAAVRWYHYNQFQAKTPTLHTNALYHGSRLFGPQRFNNMLHTLSPNATDRTNCINFAIECLELGDYYDDISDTKRTISNISEGLIAYIDDYDFERYNIWIRDPNDELTDIGIEIAFDIVVTIEYEDDQETIDGPIHILETRFTGKLDGLYIDPEKDDHLLTVDDKTASKLDDHWLTQWILSHQITGYCLAATTFTNQPCHNAEAWGMKLPIGKIAAEGIRKEKVNRFPVLYEKWACWLVHTVLLEQHWRDCVIEAPMYTHSCYSYFRSCALVPFCAADSVEEKKQIIGEMDDDEWSPLHD